MCVTVIHQEIPGNYMRKFDVSFRKDYQLDLSQDNPVEDENTSFISKLIKFDIAIIPALSSIKFSSEKHFVCV